MQQPKHLILFFIISVLILVAWLPIQQRLWPTKAKPDDRRAQVLRPPTYEAAAQVAALTGLGGAVDAAVRLGAADYLRNPDHFVLARRAPEPPPKHEPKPAPPPVAKAPAVKAPAVPHREVAIGDLEGGSRFNQGVVLTSTGGGVLRLVLNKFKQADRYGLPDGNPPPPLHLIPGDDGQASNLIYHYRPPADGHPDHPLETLGTREWELRSITKDEDLHTAVFATTLPELGVTVTKTYTLQPGTYHLGLELRFERQGGDAQPVPFRYQLVGAHGLPIEGEWYTTVYRNALIGIDHGRDFVRDLYDSRTLGFQAGGDAVLRKEGSTIRYAAVATQYFTSAVVVDNQQETGVDPGGLVSWVRPTVERPGPLGKQFLDDITVRLVSEPVNLKPGEPVVHKYLLYNGPVKVRLLGHLDGTQAVAPELVNRYENTLHLATLTDQGRFSFWSSLLISCTNVMHGFLYYLHKLVGSWSWSYGVCIILLTLMVRGCMFPLSRKQALASAKMQEKMQELAPEVKKLEEKHKGDPVALNQAKQELYLKRGINPLAMAGSCWVVLVQMPIFLGLYYALQESIHFRMAPFLWIRNLAAPDMLVWWTENIPFISRPQDQGSFLYLGPYLNILPIIAVVLMIVQQIMLTPPPTDEQQAMQQKMMKFMTAFFGLMFYKVAAGLCLYFITSSLWGLCERKLLPKRQQAGAAPAAKGKAGGPPGAPARRRSRDARGNGDGKLQKVKDMWAEVLKQAKKK